MVPRVVTLDDLEPRITVRHFTQSRGANYVIITLNSKSSRHIGAARRCKCTLGARKNWGEGLNL